MFESRKRHHFPDLVLRLALGFAQVGPAIAARRRDLGAAAALQFSQRCAVREVRSASHLTPLIQRVAQARIAKRTGGRLSHERIISLAMERNSLCAANVDANAISPSIAMPASDGRLVREIATMRTAAILQIQTAAAAMNEK